jgi:hypothetical protein
MKFFRSKQDDRLDQAISELRGEQPDAKTLSASAERVWQRLQTDEGEEAASSGLQPIRGCADIRSLLPAFHQNELPPARAELMARRASTGAWSPHHAVSSGASRDCPSRQQQ